MNPDCTKRNVVYENICNLCNPEARKSGDLKSINMEVPSIYVGETARSVQERAREHWDAFKSKDKDSHIYKHWVLHHNSEGEPQFTMKVVQYHRSALSRQVGEATRIRRRGLTLNSKSEFNRCKITRLSLEQPEVTDYVNTYKDKMEEDVKDDQTEQLLKKRDLADREDRRCLGRADMAGSQKRKEEPDGNATRKNHKKMKYAKLGDDWGLSEDRSANSFLYSGLEGTSRLQGYQRAATTKSKRTKIDQALERAATDCRRMTDFISPVIYGTREEASTPPPESSMTVPRMTSQPGVVVEWCRPRSGQNRVEWEGTGVLAIEFIPKSVSSGILPGGVKGPSPDGPTRIPEPTRNKKVWCRLRNGLFGWRVKRAGKRRRDSGSKQTGGELSKSSTNNKMGENTFMKLGNSNVGRENEKPGKRESSRPDQDLECDEMNVAKRLKK